MMINKINMMTMMKNMMRKNFVIQVAIMQIDEHKYNK